MLEAIKIECYDEEDVHGSVELNMDKAEEGSSLTVLHLEIPMLEKGRVISIYLDDFKRALRQLHLN